jgi:hypothetical protein
MPRLKGDVSDQELSDEQLREGLWGFSSDDELFELLKTMARLMISGDLGFWLSPRLVRKLRDFAVERERQGCGGGEEVDDALFLSWLQQVGSIEPKPHWEVQHLPDNGGIYRRLLEGGQFK